MSETIPVPSSTLAFYEANAEVYAAQTWDLDLVDLYEWFLAHVPHGGEVLDAGSGSGRDTAAFLRRGYRVTAFDASARHDRPHDDYWSARLAALSSEATGQPTHVLRFDEVSWRRQFDGVWAIASLLHVPEAELPDALNRLAQALKPGGVLFATFQEGMGTNVRDGRFYQFVSRDDIHKLVESNPLLDLVDIRREADPNRRKISWLQVLARRRIQ